MTTDTMFTPVAAPPAKEATRRRRLPSAEALVAIGIFAAFCLLVLTKATRLLEPDDSAYLASIIALSHGHITLTTAQYDALNAQLSAHGGSGILQWDHLPDGRWMSEKNPGYPFFAVVFQWLHILRATPLFAGALASGALYAAARRWLGRWGGTFAVALFLGSGAALAFAWRPTMPSFTDASLVAAGAGALLWTLLAGDAPSRRRCLVGLAGFLALEMATFIRYTDVVMLIVAAGAAATCARRSGITRASLLAWGGSLLCFAAGVMAFDRAFYGGLLKTGYGPGEITFSTGAIATNLRLMPPYLVEAVPATLLGLAALLWMGFRVLPGRMARLAPDDGTGRRDGLVGLFLAAGWFGLWGLYSAYTWTANQGSGHGPGGGQISIHLIRFYLPAIGLIALLGAWLLVRLPRWVAPLLLVVVALFGFVSFESLTAVGAFGAPDGGLPGSGRVPLPGPPGGLPTGGPGPGGAGPVGGSPPAGSRPVG